MRNWLKVFVLVLVITLPLGGCFKSPEQKAAERAADELSKVFGDLAKMGENGEISPEDSLKGFMELGMEMEKSEFAKQDSLDVPKGFPAEVLYKSNSKVTSVSDSSSGDYMYIELTVKTTDSADQVKEFYKGLLKNNSSWKVTGESTSSGYYSLDVQTPDDVEAYRALDVDIYSNEYSNLVEVSLYYRN
jgi:hypothetical protein